MSRIAEAFDGDTFEIKRDGVRLHTQLDCVRSILFQASKPLTLEEIAGEMERRFNKRALITAVSARIRDLGKPKFGAYEIKKNVRYGTKNLWEYKLAQGGKP